jgi:uncharacterized protein
MSVVARWARNPWRLVLMWLLAASFGLTHAQGVQPVPPLTAHVIDQTGTLDAVQVKGLEDKLMAFEQAKGTQIAILMVGTTQPEDIASYANRVGNAWKIGRKQVGDGVLVVVAKDDHRARIEVAKALEGAIPDLAAQQIIDSAMTPNFRKGDFAAGLQGAADQLIARINGEALPEPKRTAPRAHGGQGFDWADTAIFLFIGVSVVGGLLRGVLGRKLGSVVTGAGAGVIAFFLTASLVIGVVAAVVALLFMLLTGGSIGPMGTRRYGGWGGPVIGGWGAGGGSWGGGGAGGSWGGSGGGGDFGGGGASGSW